MIKLTPDEIAHVMLARQRRGVWVTLLTLGTLALWVVAAGLLVVVVHNNDQRVVAFQPEPHIHDVTAEGLEVRTYHYHGQQLTPAQTVDLMHDQLVGMRWLAPQLAATLLVFVAASLGTLAVAHAGRRTTLRQIQGSLAAIAGQLAEVQRGRGTMPPTAGG